MLAAYNEDLLQNEIVDNIVEAINTRLSVTTQPPNKTQRFG